MKELLNKGKINLETVDFRPVLEYLRDCNRTTVNGVQWAQLYITVDGRAVAVFRNGANIRARGADVPVEAVVEFFDESGAASRSFAVNLPALLGRGGVSSEALRARFTFNRCYDRNGRAVVLSKQRAVAVSTVSRSVY